ncbi:MAG: type II toxin-antitoxin system Phd/YefM family antitoxin [Balneolaceae bacterium]
MATTRIEIDQDIQPLSEFRKHAADFIDRIKKQKRSIVLTQHGKSAAVLVDVSEYQRMVDKIDLMEELIDKLPEVKSFLMKKLKSGLKKTWARVSRANSLNQSALQKLNKFVDYIARDDVAIAEKWALKVIK